MELFPIQIQHFIFPILKIHTTAMIRYYHSYYIGIYTPKLDYDVLYFSKVNFFLLKE